jgi:hypothetical protein
MKPAPRLNGLEVQQAPSTETGLSVYFFFPLKKNNAWTHNFYKGVSRMRNTQNFQHPLWSRHDTFVGLAISLNRPYNWKALRPQRLNNLREAATWSRCIGAPPSLLHTTSFGQNKKNKLKQKRHCMYNVTLCRFCVTAVAVETQQSMLCVVELHVTANCIEILSCTTMLLW